MKFITQNLQRELALRLKTADELWVAVALLTKRGFEFIQDKLPPTTIQHYVLGVDSPTDPEALEELNTLQYLGNLSAVMFVKQEFYHPKVYIIRSKHSYTAFVGSANCTYGGMFSNIELSYIIEKHDDCQDLISWFKQLEKKSVELNSTFITKYRKSFQSRKDRKEAEENQVKKVKAELEKDFEVTMDSRKALIEALERYHKLKDFDRLKNERIEDVVRLKESLDYPDFKKIDIDAFYNNWALGHLRYTPVEHLKSNLPKFKKLLKVLTDESIDVATRFNRVHHGDLQITGFKIASISKVLTMHNPNLYSVKNEKIDGVLKAYGIHIPKEISIGAQYKATSNYMVQIAKEAGFDDLAILDRFLYEEASNKTAI
jgi:HKD family nuclease